MCDPVTLCISHRAPKNWNFFDTLLKVYGSAESVSRNTSVAPDIPRHFDPLAAKGIIKKCIF